MAKQFVGPVAPEITDHNFLRTEVVMLSQLVNTNRSVSAEMSPIRRLTQAKSYLSADTEITARLGVKRPRR